MREYLVCYVVADVRSSKSKILAAISLRVWWNRIAETRTARLGAYKLRKCSHLSRGRSDSIVDWQGEWFGLTVNAINIETSTQSTFPQNWESVHGHENLRRRCIYKDTVERKGGVVIAIEWFQKR